MDVSTIFGSMVFNETVMQERLPKEIFKSLKQTMEEGTALDLTVANSVANAMKNWAIEKGVTHYTHWFQPMTGITAEKHDSFISPMPGGKVIMEFSGKELIKGEPDGSSFPSGGLRATCEARGYTAWDPTSYAFIKDGSLCIPTAFCSYSGDALDKKTPLLRSMEVIDKQCRRILKLFGKDIKKVTPTVGPEQEYFLIDKDLYDKRKDLMFCNRTIFGAKPPKGQELEDHYFGAIKPRVDAFMKELDEELWKLGILSKTKHNEVAPCQHEMAPIFTTTNLSADQNQLTMEIMKKVAQKHNLVCILHEKPFAGVNGSGKHNNWSLSTNTGENLLEPGNTPEDNAQFLLVLTAIIKAVDEYQDLLRLSVAFAGNDHRLGADEAPPAIISIFLGDELTAILESIMSGKPYDKKAKEVMKLGVDILPAFPKDNTDRNRTSPFAFTGNKFEFRSLGSSMSISCPNIMLNTITAEALCQFADELEKADDFNTALNALIKKTLNEHKRIIFNGDGYSQEWVEEAERRGLLNLKTTTDALPHFLDEKNIQLFLKHKVHTKAEIEARYKIQMEDYCKVLNIEVMTMLEMVKREILPAVINFTKDVADSALSVKNLLGESRAKTQIELVKTLSALTDELTNTTANLEEIIGKIKDYDDVTDCAKFYTAAVIPAMNDVRQIADKLETIVGNDYWPFPTYADLLFRI
ncbi:MAG: glutamine synthetase III [Spirochaetales bacterium]|nr:glutamine synthetase III [Spirochaetales bacterium]